MPSPKVCSRQPSTLSGGNAQHCLEMDIQDIEKSIGETPTKEQSRHKSYWEDRLTKSELRRPGDLLIAHFLCALQGEGVGSRRPSCLLLMDIIWCRLCLEEFKHLVGLIGDVCMRSPRASTEIVGSFTQSTQRLLQGQVASLYRATADLETGYLRR